MAVTAAPGDLTTPFSWTDKARLGVEILAVYCRVRWWLWRRDLPQVVSVLRETAREHSRDEVPGDQAAGIRLGRAVGRTLSILPSDSRCLVRSLVLTRLLARRGIRSSLVIGVTSEPEFAAHAWVESEGRPLLPPGESVYRRLVEI